MVTQVSQPEFGQRLRRLRAERGLSQRDLASGTVNQSYISLLESGARVPTLDVVLHLARVLDVSVHALADVDIASPDGAVRALARSQFVNDVLTMAAIEYGDLDDAEQRMTAAYRAALAAPAESAAALGYGLALERILELRGDRPGRYALLSELLPLADQSEVVEMRVRTRIAFSAAARDVGRLDEAYAEIERASREITGTALADGSEHIRLLAVHLSVLNDRGSSVEIMRLVETLLVVARRLDRSAITGRGQWAASIALASIGRWRRALESLTEARRMLSHPSTSLRDWASFCRAAVSVQIDAHAEPAEIAASMEAARAATMAESSVANVRLAALEVRFAVATGDPERAIALAAAVADDELPSAERIRFLHARGQAERLAGQEAQAVATLRFAAQLAEETSAFRHAARIWRDINEPA
ncbi:DNA-binding XRE family transcriptional regulator [Krasilnikovia cinnamomea]|uniref:DNA-binding XRE family transcriptional regulator n=1 Tax=Krasilnikovia cinnamomea TaxID=349313 RepID=A0A4Q7ZK84_9ACTN|nr:helix-turn-helix transcriptional regulator [Krasilnikovia cinnamomea]RZU51327.1 DNA-binding XRE family transcriptional regulator [Krasilnikovia cinnamomea]